MRTHHPTGALDGGMAVQLPHSQRTRRAGAGNAANLPFGAYALSSEVRRVRVVHVPSGVCTVCTRTCAVRNVTVGPRACHLALVCDRARLARTSMRSTNRARRTPAWRWRRGGWIAPVASARLVVCQVLMKWPQIGAVCSIPLERPEMPGEIASSELPAVDVAAVLRTASPFDGTSLILQEVSNFPRQPRQVATGSCDRKAAPPEQ